jgi:anionic cell wall polymer biosynthesis LytR-Cps2A-Psr (LCP) family protein
MSGYPAGIHHLNGLDSLAFVRDRSGSDDFFRMQRAQIFLTALWKRMLDPVVWRQFPEIYPLIIEIVDTNIPLHKWPFLAFTLLRVGPDEIDTQIITRDMTHPFTTSSGAQVLGPNWEAINPVIDEMFGE